MNLMDAIVECDRAAFAAKCADRGLTVPQDWLNGLQANTVVILRQAESLDLLGRVDELTQVAD